MTRTTAIAASILAAAALSACNDPNAKKAGDDLQSAAANAGEAAETQASDAMAAAANAADAAGDAAGDAVANTADNAQRGAAEATAEADQAMNADDLAAAGDTSLRPAEDAPAQ